MSTRPSNVPRIYDEDLQPQFETKDTPKSHLLLVHVPAGFAREQIGAKVEIEYGRVVVFGERPLEDKNRWSRFNITHQVPEYCDVNRSEGKYEGGIVTIKMPRKVISREVPTTDKGEEPPKSPTEPNPTTEVEQDKAERKAPKGQEGISQGNNSRQAHCWEGGNQNLKRRILNFFKNFKSRH